VSLRVLLASALLLSTWTSLARAEVATIELLGDQASLMGGAVTASTRGGSSIWYNPARLWFGSGENITFSVSGVGFVYRYYNLPKMVLTPDASYPAQGSELLVLPRATTLVMRARENLYWGVGLFTPARQQVVLQAGSASASDQASFNSVATEVRRNSLHTVGSVSWKASERFQLGGSLAFVTYLYFHSVQTSSARYDANTSQAMAVFTSSSRQNNTGYGARATLGISFRLADNWHLGASVASPTLLFFSNVQEVQNVNASPARPEAPTFAGDLHEKRGASWQRPEPATARVGVSYTSASVLIELDADGFAGASASDFNVAKQAAGNLRAGALFGLKKQLRIGFGLFTDLEQPGKSLNKLGDSRASGVGGTCGVNFVSRLPGKPAKPDNPEGTYSITLAVRYAHFKGKVLSLAVSDPGQVDGLALQPTSAVVHEAAAQLSLNGAW
jgi:hypothetical protein